MVRQLSLDVSVGGANPEAQLESICGNREDVPRGMSRLTS